MSLRNRLTACSDVAPLLVFYACDEVEPKERQQIEAHLSACNACAQQLREEQGMQAALLNAFQPADQLDPSGILLAQCRSELSELLDDLSAPLLREQWTPFGWLWRWMALRPAWSAALLLIVGLVVGTQVALWIPGRDSGGIGQAVSVNAAPPLTSEQLANMDVAGISPASDSSPGTFQLQVRTEQPLVLTGSVDDSQIRQVLTYVVSNGQRFDPGVRLDCLEALKARSSELDVRHALLAAARHDHTPAVRMKALEALRDAAQEADVRDALVDALEHDANPGVRVQAVNMLVRSLPGITGAPEAPEGPDAGDTPAAPETPRRMAESKENPPDPSVARVMRILSDLQRSDPNRYVRLRSAAALRQINPRESESNDPQ